MNGLQWKILLKMNFLGVPLGVDTVLIPTRWETKELYIFIYIYIHIYMYSGGPAVRISKTVFAYVGVPHIYIYIYTYLCIFECSHK